MGMADRYLDLVPDVRAVLPDRHDRTCAPLRLSAGGEV